MGNKFSMEGIQMPIGIFDPSAEPWETWMMQLKSILEADGIVEGTTKTSFLIGSLTMKAKAYLLKNPRELAFQDLPEKLRQFYGMTILLMKKNAGFFKKTETDDSLLGN